MSTLKQSALKALVLATVLVLIDRLKIVLLDSDLAVVDKDFLTAMILELSCKRLDIFLKKNL